MADLQTTGVLVEQNQTFPRLLHILNGDSVRMTIENSAVPGKFSVWADALHEGPVPGGLSPEQFRQVRSTFWAANDWRSPNEEQTGMLERWDNGLASFSNYDEVVMWFEHDLFDQLILIHHLDFFARHNGGQTAVSLICIDRFPGVDPFLGLGQLNADQLSSLLGTRQPVTQEQLDLGRAAWTAFTSPDPMGLPQLISGDTSALPFLKAALLRFLEEYPSKPSGLPRTERQILTVLAAGPRSPERLFRAMYDLEQSVFMGDLSFWLRVKALADGPNSLVDLTVTERPDCLPTGEVKITDVGRAALKGEADWVTLNGIDRWLGGVHLQGREVAWRWDDEASRLTNSE
jgi:hypothetical protein